MFRSAHTRRGRGEHDWAQQPDSPPFLHAASYGLAEEEEEDEAALVDAEVAQLEEILRASQEQQQHTVIPTLPRIAHAQKAQSDSHGSAAHAARTHISSSSSTSSSLVSPPSAATASVSAPPPPTLRFDLHPALTLPTPSVSAATLQTALDANIAYQRSIQASLSDIERELDQLAEERRLLLAVYQHSWLHAYSATTAASPLLSLPRAALFTFPYLVAPPPTTTPDSATTTTSTAATAATAATVDTTTTSTAPDCLLRTHPHRHHAVAWNEQERLSLELAIQHSNHLAALKRSLTALGADAKPDAVQAAVRAVQAESAAHWLSAGVEDVDWALVAASYVPTRSPTDCRLQWTNRLDPRISHAAWSEAEDAFLLRHAPTSAVRPMRHWVDVAAGLGTQRTAWQCMTRYVRTLRPVQAKDSPWSEAENRRLLWLVDEEEGSKDWVRVAERMDGRTDQQCMHRYLKVLKPLEQSRLAKGPWTVAADLRLRLAVLAYGVRWSEVARLVGGGRSDVSCRERWVNVLRGGETATGQLRRGGWGKEEEGRLREVVGEVGEVWTEVAERMQGRTDRMCRKKWRRMQNNEKKQRVKEQQAKQAQESEQKEQVHEPTDEAKRSVDDSKQPRADSGNTTVDNEAEMKQAPVDDAEVKVEGRLRSYRKRQRNEVRDVPGIRRGRRRKVTK